MTSKTSSKKRPLRLAKYAALSFGLLTVAVSSVGAASLYWDINGATAGSGGPTPTGAWDGVATNFNVAADGTGATQATTALTDDVFFSAGTDATGAYTVTVTGAQSANSITVEEGAPLTLAGATTPSLTVGGGGIMTAAASRLTVTTAPLLLAASQSWSSNNTGATAATGYFTVAAATSGVANTGAITLTLTGTNATGAASSTTGGTQISGVISNGTGNTLSVVKSGTGIWYLDQAANTYSGGTTINSGELQAGGGSGATITSLGSGTITFNGGILSARGAGRTLNNAVTVNSDFGIGSTNTAANAITLGGTVNLTGATRTITVGTNAATISGVISNGGLTKAGIAASSLTLSGANTYTGTTTLNGGILLLAATGNINSSNTINVTAGALTLQNATALSDAGTLSLVTGATLNLNAAAGTTETIAGLILNGTVEPAGTYAAADLAGLSGASGITFASANGETLTVAAVPEPSTLISGFALLSVGGVAAMRRRRAVSAL